MLPVLVSGFVPSYQSAGAAGADLIADIEVPVTLKPMERILIPTNTYLAIPEGYEGQVRSRSGLANRYGVVVINAPGTIDFDYRGEIKVTLINLGDGLYEIQPKERIAQLVIVPYVIAQFVGVHDSADLSSTERNTGGLGSTGRF